MSQAADHSTPDITFEALDGTGAGAHADELQALHAEVYAGPHGRDDEAARFSGRFRVQRRQPGYVRRWGTSPKTLKGPPGTARAVPAGLRAWP